MIYEQFDKAKSTHEKAFAIVNEQIHDPVLKNDLKAKRGRQLIYVLFAYFDMNQLEVRIQPISLLENILME